MLRIIFLCTAVLLTPVIAISDPEGTGAQEVDLELVLAADVSGSVSSTLAQAQRVGFAQAFRDPQVFDALASGPLGEVAVIYFEWAGPGEQHIVVPWTLIRNAEDAADFADRLEFAQTRKTSGETSISGAMLYAAHLLHLNDYVGLRKVVDIASNGVNSDGPPVHLGRRVLRDSGAIVNALVLPDRVLEQLGPYGRLFLTEPEPLDDYYRTTVIGGPGAFVQSVDMEVGFNDAILRKLVLEVAWLTK